MATFRLEILTPYRRLFQGQATSLLFRTIDGDFMVYAGHEPVAAPVVPCVLHVDTPDGLKFAASAEGFCTVKPDRVELFLDAAEWSIDIDRKRAEEALERAMKRLGDGSLTWEQSRAKYAAARARARLATLDASVRKRAAAQG